jgi:cytochrome c biogenesis protein CcdA
VTETEREGALRTRGRARWALLIAATLLVSLTGYGGFRLYPTIGSATGLGLLVVAAAAGFAAFFSPCSFPLLLTLVARQAAEKGSQRIRSAFRFATGASLGATAFLLGFGLLLSLVGGTVADYITLTSTGGRMLRVVVGVVLIVMGLVQLGTVRLSFSRLASLAAPIESRRSETGDPQRFLNHVLFGFGYLVAGFG